jgi:hypothetical protein
VTGCAAKCAVAAAFHRLDQASTQLSSSEEEEQQDSTCGRRRRRQARKKSDQQKKKQKQQQQQGAAVSREERLRKRQKQQRELEEEEEGAQREQQQQQQQQQEQEQGLLANQANDVPPLCVTAVSFLRSVLRPEPSREVETVAVAAGTAAAAPPPPQPAGAAVAVGATAGAATVGKQSKNSSDKVAMLEGEKRARRLLLSFGLSRKAFRLVLRALHQEEERQEDEHGDNKRGAKEKSGSEALLQSHTTHNQESSKDIGFRDDGLPIAGAGAGWERNWLELSSAALA